VGYRASARGTHKFMGIASTGKPVMFTTIVISRIVNGKFQEDWKSFDGMYVLQQLDALPTS
jgi:predicted ester cyclase